MFNNFRVVARLSLILVATVLVPASPCPAQENTVFKEIEVIYARRDRAIKAKDFALLKTDQADDYTERSKDGTVTNRQEADAEADELFKTIREVQEYDTKVESLKGGKKKNEVVVEVSESGKLSLMLPDGKLHEMTARGRSRDRWRRTQEGWRIVFHEEIESIIQLDGKPIN